jgi:hypothetical protein
MVHDRHAAGQRGLRFVLEQAGFMSSMVATASLLLPSRTSQIIRSLIYQRKEMDWCGDILIMIWSKTFCVFKPGVYENLNLAFGLFWF